MSTWCAAKNLFLYYRKYLSEHICNKLLWEHIWGSCSHNIRRWIHVPTADSGASRATHAFCPSPPLHTATENWFSLTFQHFQVLYTYGCGSSYCLSGFAERDRDLEHIAFPLLFPCSTQAKVFLFAKANLEPGERMWGKCLPCSPSPPPLLSEAPLACDPARRIDTKGPRVTNSFPAAEIIPAELIETQCLGETAIPDRYHLLSSDTTSAALFIYVSEW